MQEDLHLHHAKTQTSGSMTLARHQLMVVAVFFIPWKPGVSSFFPTTTGSGEGGFCEGDQTRTDFSLESKNH